MSDYTMMLCAGRHEFPDVIHGAIFPQTISNPTDIALIDEICENSLRGHVHSGDTLYVYVTGLTVCTVAVINWCLENWVNLTLLHYDRATCGYVHQVVFDKFATAEELAEFEELLISEEESFPFDEEYDDGW